MLYWDTDSVIFTSKEGDWDPPVGDFLGELTNELDKGDWITEFVCNGPKNYAYQTHAGKRVCKVKGFSLNFENAQKINLESMRDAMFNREDPHTQEYIIPSIRTKSVARKYIPNCTLERSSNIHQCIRNESFRRT